MEIKVRVIERAKLGMPQFFKEAGERLERLLDEPKPSVWDLLNRESLERIELGLVCDIERWVYYKNSDNNKAQENWEKLVAVRKLLGR